jgi:hypothetical protein
MNQRKRRRYHILLPPLFSNDIFAHKKCFSLDLLEIPGTAQFFFSLLIRKKNLTEILKKEK